jgi:hypothetical protein
MYEKLDNQGFRQRIQKFFREKIATEPGIITSQIDEQKPGYRSLD